MTALARWMTVIEQRLGDQGEYRTLDRFMCADISVASALMHAEASQMPMNGHPIAQAWLDRVRARPSWVATNPPPMPN